jgi:hypothetical protein
MTDDPTAAHLAARVLAVKPAIAARAKRLGGEEAHRPLDLLEAVWRALYAGTVDARHFGYVAEAERLAEETA